MSVAGLENDLGGEGSAENIGPDSNYKCGQKRGYVPDRKPPAEIVFDLDDKKKITLRKWRNKTYIDIREFYTN